MKLKILMSSASATLWDAMELHYVDGMRKQTDVVEFFGGEKSDACHKGILGRIKTRLFPKWSFRSVNQELLELAKRNSPDVIFLFKAAYIFPVTLRRLRESGAKLVNYNADHPFEFMSRGSGGSNVTNCIPLYDLHISYSRRIQKQMAQRFPNSATEVVPFGHFIDDNLFEKTVRAAGTEIEKVCFVGNPDQNRANTLHKLVAAGVPTDVYGHGWGKFLKPNESLKIHPAVLGEEYFQTLRKYRVQINLFRPHNLDSHNMRSFEVPAIGGVMLAEDSSEHREFFEDGKEAFYFKSNHALIELAKSLLKSPKRKIDAIRRAARDRCVFDRSHYDERAVKVFEILANLAGTKTQRTNYKDIM